MSLSINSHRQFETIAPSKLQLSADLELMAPIAAAIGKAVESLKWQARLRFASLRSEIEKRKVLMRREFRWVDQKVRRSLQLNFEREDPRLAKWQKISVQVRESINHGIEVETYQFLLRKALRSLNDFHFGVSFNAPQGSHRVVHLPIQCYSAEQRLYVQSNRAESDLPHVRPNDEIVSIGGVPAYQYLLNHYDSFERDSHSRPMIGLNEIQNLFERSTADGTSASEKDMQLELCSHDLGTNYGVKLPWREGTMPLENPYAVKRTKFIPVCLDQAPEFTHHCEIFSRAIHKVSEQLSVGYLHLHMFYIDDDPEDEDYKQFYHTLEEFADKTQAIILDLRCNNGGSMQAGIDILGCFLERTVELPYTMYGDNNLDAKLIPAILKFFDLRLNQIGPITDQTHERILDAKEYYEIKRERLIADREAENNDQPKNNKKRPVEKSIPFQIPPNSRCLIKNRLYALIDESTFSAGEHLAVFLQDTTDAVLMGSQTFGGGGGFKVSEKYLMTPGSFQIANLAVPTNQSYRNAENRPEEFAVKPDRLLPYTKKDYYDDGCDFNNSLQEMIQRDFINSHELNSTR